MLSNSTSLHIGTLRPVDVDNAVTGHYQVHQVMTITEWRTIVHAQTTCRTGEQQPSEPAHHTQPRQDMRCDSVGVPMANVVSKATWPTGDRAGAPRDASSGCGVVGALLCICDAEAQVASVSPRWGLSLHTAATETKTVSEGARR